MLVIPAMWGAGGRDEEDGGLRLALGKNARPYPKNKTKRAEGMVQMVSSNPNMGLEVWFRQQSAHFVSMKP
jgi:hypothetical protein